MRRRRIDSWFARETVHYPQSLPAPWWTLMLMCRGLWRDQCMLARIGLLGHVPSSCRANHIGYTLCTVRSAIPPKVCVYTYRPNVSHGCCQVSCPLYRQASGNEGAGNWIYTGWLITIQSRPRKFKMWWWADVPQERLPQFAGAFVLFYYFFSRPMVPIEYGAATASVNRSANTHVWFYQGWLPHDC